MKHILIAANARLAQTADVSVPPELVVPLRNLMGHVQEHPKAITVWDARTRKLMMTLQSVQSDTLFSTRGPDGQRGLCGALPLLRWLKARTVRIAVGRKELTFRDLLKVQK